MFNIVLFLQMLIQFLDELFLSLCLYDSYFYFSNLIILSPLSKIG